MKIACWQSCILALAAAAVSGCLTGERESLYVMDERYEVTDSAQEPPAVGCVLAISDDGSGGSLQAELTPDLRYDAATSGDGLRVRVLSGGVVTKERFYDEDFIRSGQVDEFEVVTLEQRTFVFRHWGGSVCETDLDTRE